MSATNNIYALSRDNYNIEWGMGYVQRKKDISNIVEYWGKQERKAIRNIKIQEMVVSAEVRDHNTTDNWQPVSFFIHILKDSKAFLNHSEIVNKIEAMFSQKLAKALIGNLHNKYLIKQIANQMSSRQYINQDQFDFLSLAFDFLDTRILNRAPLL